MSEEKNDSVKVLKTKLSVLMTHQMLMIYRIPIKIFCLQTGKLTTGSG